MNAQRIQAIFEKDIKDAMKNTMTLFTPFLPIILALFYSQLGDAGEEMPLMVVYTVIGMTFSAVTAGLIMTFMAEEKEKKTLRGLMLSPASFLDIIIGKSLATTLLTFISLIISLLIVDSQSLLNLQAITGILILFFFFLFLGIGVGLLVKSVGMTTAYLMPIMFLFGFTPMIDFMGLAEDSLTMKIASAFPLPQLLEMDETKSWLAIGVVTLWMIGAALFAMICYRRVRQDD